MIRVRDLEKKFKGLNFQLTALANCEAAFHYTALIFFTKVELHSLIRGISSLLAYYQKALKNQKYV
jgi:hypothetical protein